MNVKKIVFRRILYIMSENLLLFVSYGSDCVESVLPLEILQLHE